MKPNDQINADGKAFNGNYAPVILAGAIIGAAISVCAWIAVAAAWESLMQAAGL